MPTFAQQRLADLTAVLADPHGPARTVAIGSVSVAAIDDQPSLAAADGEGLLVERRTLHCLAGVLGFVPVTGQELLVDGVRWMVESCPPGEVLAITLARYRT